MSEATEHPRLLLSIPEAAKLLGVSRRTAYTATRKGGLRTGELYPGGQRYVPRSEIDRIANGGTRPQRSHLRAWHSNRKEVAS